jgi:hypothetical protein
MEVPTGALFLLTDEEAAKLFVKEDPYVSGGMLPVTPLKNGTWWFKRSSVSKVQPVIRNNYILYRG